MKTNKYENAREYMAKGMKVAEAIKKADLTKAAYYYHKKRTEPKVSISESPTRTSNKMDKRSGRVFVFMGNPKDVAATISAL